jgi:hypothetical protein
MGAPDRALFSRRLLHRSRHDLRLLCPRRFFGVNLTRGA